MVEEMTELLGEGTGRQTGLHRSEMDVPTTRGYAGRTGHPHDVSSGAESLVYQRIADSYVQRLHRGNVSTIRTPVAPLQLLGT